MESCILKLFKQVFENLEKTFENEWFIEYISDVFFYKWI